MRMRLSTSPASCRNAAALLTASILLIACSGGGGGGGPQPVPFTDITIQQNGTNAGSPGTIVVSFVGGKTPYTISYIIDTYNVTPSRVPTRPANGLHSDTLNVIWGPQASIPFVPDEARISVVATDALGAVVAKALPYTLIPNAAQTLGLTNGIRSDGGDSMVTVGFDAGTAEGFDVTMGDPAGATVAPAHKLTTAGDTGAVFVFTPVDPAAGCDGVALVTISKPSGEQESLFITVTIPSA